MFLFMAQEADPTGKTGGACCSYTPSGESGPMIYGTLQHVCKMDTLNLGALNLKENIIDTREGARACHDYGKAFVQKFTRYLYNPIRIPFFPADAARAHIHGQWSRHSTPSIHKGCNSSCRIRRRPVFDTHTGR
jgi:hypothetical protein